eukprot:7266486-Prorocentrum_lima.AAC.1
MDDLVGRYQWSPALLAEYIAISIQTLASPTASLTLARLVPVAVLGKLVTGIRKWEAPESHIAN